MSDVRIRVELINQGKEIRVLANHEGFKYLAEACTYLAEADYDDRRAPHYHIEEALYSAEPDSVPLELYLTSKP